MKRPIFMLALLIVALGTRLDAQRPGGPGGQPGMQPDPFARFLFPPELVMQHQGEIGLQDAQRSALQTAILAAQSKFLESQMKLSGEGEKLANLLQGATADESQVLEEVDRVLALEREVKRAQMGLLIRIKNLLTPAQQAKLRELRESRD
jgi:Spy/CpxP family protein refolding chaperone